MGVTTPTWTDQVQAWGTLTGAVLSAAAVLVALLLYKHEKETRLIERFDRDAEQARSVAVVVTEMHSEGSHPNVTVQVTNYSQHPIFGLSFYLHHGRLESGCSHHPNVLGPSDCYEVEFNPQLPARERRTKEDYVILASVHFADTSGRRWTRTSRQETKRREPSTTLRMPRRVWYRLKFRVERKCGPTFARLRFRLKRLDGLVSINDLIHVLDRPHGVVTVAEERGWSVGKLDDRTAYRKGDVMLALKEGALARYRNRRRSSMWATKSKMSTLRRQRTRKRG